MHMDITLALAFLALIYGWPFLIGAGSAVVLSNLKARGFFVVVAKSYACLIGAILLSGLLTFATDTWLTPYANSISCIERQPECAYWLLQAGDWLYDWQYVSLIVIAFICAVFLAVKQVKAFNNQLKERPSGAGTSGGEPPSAP